MVMKSRAALAEINQFFTEVNTYDNDLDQEISATPLWYGLGVRVITGGEDTDEVCFFNLADEYIIAGGLARQASWVLAKLASLFADKSEYIEESGLFLRVTAAANNYLSSFTEQYRTPLALMLAMLQEARKTVIDYIIMDKEIERRPSTRRTCREKSRKL